MLQIKCNCTQNRWLGDGGNEKRLERLHYTLDRLQDGTIQPAQVGKSNPEMKSLRDRKIMV